MQIKLIYENNVVNFVSKKYLLKKIMDLYLGNKVPHNVKL